MAEGPSAELQVKNAATSDTQPDRSVVPMASSFPGGRRGAELGCEPVKYPLDSPISSLLAWFERGRFINEISSTRAFPGRPSSCGDLRVGNGLPVSASS